MVKLTGPGLAQSASGQLAGELIFSNWKGRAYLKKHANPKQPQARGQVGMRAMLEFLSSNWSQISDANQATWNDLAAQTNISPFNAYLAYNLRRHRSNQRPTQAYPAAEEPYVSFAMGYSATGGVRCIKIYFQVQTKSEGWGNLLSHVAGDDVQPTFQDAIHVIPIYSTGPHSWTWTPVPAGDYWISFSPLTVTGLFTAAGVFKMATVTD